MSRMIRFLACSGRFRRRGVVIDGAVRWLSPQVHLLLLHLAAARESGDGWWPGDKDVEAPDWRLARMVYRVRREVPDVPIENDRCGNYRLALPTTAVEIERELHRDPDYWVRAVFGRDT